VSVLETGNWKRALMRIIAGQYRSRHLHSLRGTDTRPTSDRLRETLFNVLTAGRPAAIQPAAASPDAGIPTGLADTVWLDVFAGTGAVGLEALSRGARMVYFIESTAPAAALIRQNLQSLGIRAGYEVIGRDAVQALRLLDAKAVACDFCFLDPPYRDADAYKETLGFLSQSRLLHPATIVAVEHDKHFDPGPQCGALARFRLLPQGDSRLSFYRRP
jgi:16S rRNA (guanine(966)-N(2))-methyltransferase RsmD